LSGVADGTPLSVVQCNIGGFKVGFNESVNFFANFVVGDFVKSVGKIAWEGEGRAKGSEAAEDEESL
jgi:hypothetical protein